MKIYEGMDKPEEAPVAFTKDGVLQGYFWNLISIAFGDGGLFPTKDAAYQEKIRQLEAKVSKFRQEQVERIKEERSLQERARARAKELSRMFFLKRWYRTYIADPMD